MTPRPMSSMNVVPAQAAENSAVIMTTPGVRKAMNDCPSLVNPGISMTLENSWPNSSSQIIGWMRVMSRYAGCRTNPVSDLRVSSAEWVRRAVIGRLHRGPRTS